MAFWQVNLDSEAISPLSVFETWIGGLIGMSFTWRKLPESSIVLCDKCGVDRAEYVRSEGGLVFCLACFYRF